MPNTPLTKIQGEHLVRLVMIFMGLMLALVIYVFAQSYIGRNNVVKYQRDDCNNRKNSIRAVLNVNGALLDAFEDTDERNEKPLTQKRKHAEKVIADQLAPLQARLRADCNKQFPKEGLFPW